MTVMPVARHSLRFTDKGIALVMVLWVMVLLSIIGMNFLQAGRWNSFSTRSLKDETSSYYLALSGFHEAVNYLMLDRDAAGDFVDKDGRLWVDRKIQPVAGSRATEDGEVDIQITDEDSRLNINTATPEQLRQLFQHSGVDKDAIDGIVDSIMDWKDADRLEHLYGAEDDYYQGLAEPYRAKNGPFDTPEELVLVKGITHEVLYGGKDIRAVLPLITTFGRGSMNINTVSRGMMGMMGLDTFEVEAILKQRTEETGGFGSVPEEFAAKGLNVGPVSVLRIQVSARAKNSRLGSSITAVVQRQPAGGGYRVHTIYWREREEGIRS